MTKEQGAWLIFVVAPIVFVAVVWFTTPADTEVDRRPRWHTKRHR